MSIWPPAAVASRMQSPCTACSKEDEREAQNNELDACMHVWVPVDGRWEKKRTRRWWWRGGVVLDGRLWCACLLHQSIPAVGHLRTLLLTILSVSPSCCVVVLLSFYSFYCALLCSPLLSSPSPSTASELLCHTSTAHLVVVWFCVCLFNPLHLGLFVLLVSRYRPRHPLPPPHPTRPTLVSSH